ncbi:unnamed protein product [Nezara viridula]|uniref:Cystatin domain-containing protein n=1 Tax=Nezara viridula TaxID=85310 RepID=A0A9P0E2M4_NEZVI|nr:unnamed protein product [Nezara viridula]
MMKLNVFFLLISCALCIYYVSAESCEGCEKLIDPKNPVLSEKIGKFVSEHNTLSDEEPKQEIIIINSTEQVVKGIKYVIEFKAVGVITGKHYICYCSWFEQEWFSKEPQLLEYKCSRIH